MPPPLSVRTMGAVASNSTAPVRRVPPDPDLNDETKPDAVNETLVRPPAGSSEIVAPMMLRIARCVLLLPLSCTVLMPPVKKESSQLTGGLQG